MSQVTAEKNPIGRHGTVIPHDLQPEMLTPEQLWVREQVDILYRRITGATALAASEVHVVTS